MPTTDPPFTTIQLTTTAHHINPTTESRKQDKNHHNNTYLSTTTCEACHALLAAPTPKCINIVIDFGSFYMSYCRSLWFLCILFACMDTAARNGLVITFNARYTDFQYSISPPRTCRLHRDFKQRYTLHQFTCTEFPRVNFTSTCMDTALHW